MSSSSPNAAEPGSPIRRAGLSAGRAAMLIALLAAALVSFVVVRAQQGSGSAIVRQQGATAHRVTAAAVGRLVKVAKDPSATGAPRRTACHSAGRGLLRNPWSCTISYPAGQRISWVIEIMPSGRFLGIGQTIIEPGKPVERAGGEITGCCIAVP